MVAVFQAVYARAKVIASAVYGFSPFAAGIACGYFGHPFIKAGVDVCSAALRHIVG